jgi:TonB-linked SusC/RagA family outer membrane protein
METQTMHRVPWIAASLVALALGPATLAAQQTGTIVGTVIDAGSQRPLQSAQVFIPGTAVGALTNQSGRFLLLNVPAGPQTIRTVLIGYNQNDQTVTVGAGATVQLSIVLDPTAVALEGLVVTALGLERQARTLGVAAAQIDDNQLNRVASNLVTSLSGQVAGVNITSATTQGGSSRIVMRGENSLLGDNQPLFVVDGVPLDNYTGSGTGLVGSGGIVVDQGGYDYGSVISDIDPDLIESITVLKGPNAAALYGSRAANGAIVIETKKGIAALGGANITVSQTASWEDVLRLPQYQNSYGQGHAGLYEYYDGDGNGLYDEYDESWGPALDGRLLPQWNSRVTGRAPNGRAILEPLPWVARPNNVRDFFETGQTLVTNASVAAATDRLNGRLGFSRFSQDGIVPGFDLERTTVSFAGGMEATEKLGLNTSLQYITHEGNNRPAQGYDPNNPMSQLGIWWGRQIDVKALREHYQDRYPAGHPAEGELMSWQRHYWNNPYHHQLSNSNNDTRDRLIGQVSGAYQVRPWLNAMARTSIDWYQDNRLRAWAEDNCCGTYTTNPLTFTRDIVEANGAFANWEIGFKEINTDFLVSANPDLGLPVTTTFSVGGNRRDWDRRHDYVWVGDLATPSIYNVSNAASTPQSFVRSYRKRVNSMYGQAELGYNNYAFLTVTGRNDWSSTLPEENRSFFYPSVSASFVFSDAIASLRESTTLSYGKLRASWARVGSDTDPYALRNAYTTTGAEIWEGKPSFTIPGALANPNLKPEITESVEFGAELAFLNDRLGFDLTYYREETSDQIMPVNVSATTGFTSRWLNAGTIENKGWEVLVNAVPYESGDFRWQTSVTWSKNDSKVAELAEGITGLEISQGDFWGATVFAREGEPYGQIMGRAYLRVPDHVAEHAGKIIVNSIGAPSRTPDLRVIGNFNPDWRAGWQNQFSWRGLSLSSLVDVKQGGDLYSVTKMWGTYTGVLAETGDKGRCNLEATPGGYPVCTAENGIIFNGVRRVITGADTTYVANTTPIDGNTLGIYNNYFTHEANIIDAGFIKLREVTLSYDIPTSLTDRAGISGLSIALIGRNLWLKTPDENPHIDPETSSEANNVQGLEYGQTPPARSFGVTLSVRP